MSAPQPVSVDLATLLGPGSQPPFNPLRLANNGVNAPLCAQYVHMLLRELPRAVARYPRSAEFRAHAHLFWARQPVFLDATRTDVESGLAWLSRNGFLPDWVFYGDGRGDAFTR
ncbi:MAG: hypothetical protein QM675_07255 [Protaetiibacter sp.]